MPPSARAKAPRGGRDTAAAAATTAGGSSSARPCARTHGRTSAKHAAHEKAANGEEDESGDFEDALDDDALEVVRKLGAFSDNKQRKRRERSLQAIKQNNENYEKYIKSLNDDLNKGLRQHYADFRAADIELTREIEGDVSDIHRCLVSLEAVLDGNATKLDQSNASTVETAHEAIQELKELEKDGRRQLQTLRAAADELKQEMHA